MGRTLYTPELAEEICERIAKGETLSEVCRSEGMPPRTSVLEWAATDRDGFADKYAYARDRQIEHWADELLSISDDGSNDWMERNERNNPGWQLNGEHVQRSRLRSDNRKWLLSKLRPDKYGERIAHTGANGKPLIPEGADDPQRIAAAFVAALTRSTKP